MPFTLHEELGCFGYYQFGSGYAITMFGQADDVERMTFPDGQVGRSTACDRCPVKAGCWDEHKIRVREMFPSAMEQMDALVAEGFKGPALISAWIERSGQTPEKFVEPLTSVMASNFSDGSFVAGDQKPKNVTWPLERRPKGPRS